MTTEHEPSHSSAVSHIAKFFGAAAVWTGLIAAFSTWGGPTWVTACAWAGGVVGLGFAVQSAGLSARIRRESEQRYRRQLLKSEAVMLIIDPANGAICDANDAACTFYGYGREQLLQRTLYDLNCAGDDLISQALSEASSGMFHPFLFPQSRADGSVRDVEVFCSLIETDGTRRLHAIVVDITNRLVVERQLYERMKFAENLLHSAPTPMFVLDSNHRVLIWNRALEELTGVTAKELVGTKEQWKPFYPSARPCPADLVLDGAYNEEPDQYPGLTRSRFIPDGLHGEGDYRFGTRSYHLAYTAAPVFDSSGATVAAIETLEDITGRVSLEAQLSHAQKMELVGVLAGSLAHDFNNLLTVINGYADLLKMSLSGDTENLAVVQEISTSVNRAADMTRSLLAFSGRHDIQLQFDDLHTIVTTTRKTLSRLVREDINFTVLPGDAPLPVFVDRVQIEQILINLVVNARDVLKTGGYITVSASAEQLTEERREGMSVIPAGRYACLSVTDNGCGIPADTLEHIFEPFFTAKENGRGAGLGLTIVQNIVAKHNGHISVITAPGEGCRFNIYLPLFSGSEPEAADPEKTAAVPAKGSNETILVVEDDHNIMQLYQEMLGRHGYSVLTAADGLAGLEMFNTHRDTIRLAIVDVIMPNMNGRDLVELMRRQHPDLPVIMTSGYTDDIIDRTGIQALDAVFLNKPVRQSELLKAISAGIQSGSTTGGARRKE